MGSPLICDVYEHDVAGKPDIAGVVNAGPPWHGIILKATQGDYYTGGEWFRKYWPLARSEAGDGFGHDWFRGCYHYIDLWPIVDVESARNPEKPDADAVREDRAIPRNCCSVESWQYLASREGLFLNVPAIERASARRIEVDPLASAGPLPGAPSR
jgi:hypothetical protein